jgi:hypothetical protein
MEADVTLEDFRLLVARISLAAPLGSVKVPKPRPKRVVRLPKPVRPATMRPA